MECLACGQLLKPAPTTLGWSDCGVWRNGEVIFNGRICFVCIKKLAIQMLNVQLHEMEHAPNLAAGAHITGGPRADMGPCPLHHEGSPCQYTGRRCICGKYPCVS